MNETNRVGRGGATWHKTKNILSAQQVVVAIDIFLWEQVCNGDKADHNFKNISFFIALYLKVIKL